MLGVLLDPYKEERGLEPLQSNGYISDGPKYNLSIEVFNEVCMETGPAALYNTRLSTYITLGPS